MTRIANFRHAHWIPVSVREGYFSFILILLLCSKQCLAVKCMKDWVTITTTPLLVVCFTLIANMSYGAQWMLARQSRYAGKLLFHSFNNPNLMHLSIWKDSTDEEARSTRKMRNFLCNLSFSFFPFLDVNFLGEYSFALSTSHTICHSFDRFVSNSLNIAQHTFARDDIRKLQKF